MKKLVHYLLVFDHAEGQLIHECPYDDGSEAVTAYAVAEETYRDRERVEVVLIASDSIETIRRTHANYFDGTVTVSHLLAGL